MGNKVVWLLFSLQGRVPRKTYWLYLLVVVGVLYLPHLPFLKLGEEIWENYIVVVILLFWWPSIAIQVKRWHDIDSSGLWILVNFVPFIGGLWALIANGLLRGTPGDNLYGPDPYAHKETN